MTIIDKFNLVKPLLKRKISFVLTKFLIALVIIFLSFSLSTYALTHLPPKANTSTIVITADGFQPKELVVQKNSRVIFLNQDSQPHWIASNDHPTHQLYPEFDIKHPLLPSQSWEFTFDRAGIWPYHDHLAPQTMGKITVLDPSGAPAQKFTPPKNEITKTIDKIAKEQGAVAAWHDFKSKYPNSYLGAHDLAHYIGSLIYQQKGLPGLKECDWSYAFGCYHGVIEALIQKEGLNNLKSVVSFCETLPKSQGEITCYHGLGHGILPYYKYDLSQALQLCDNILPLKNQQFCYNGVFMENANINSSQASKINPYWPCNVVDEKYQDTCYGYQMVLLQRIYSSDVKQIAQVCSLIGKEQYTESCIRGLGQQIAQFNADNYDQIISQCQLAEGDNSSRCIISAAEELVFQRESFDQIKTKFCDPLTQPWIQKCQSRIETQKQLQAQS